MIKRVNIATRTPIRVLQIPIRGNVNNINMSTDDIFKCICQKAIVDEVLPSGKLVRLSLSNYNKDNSEVVEVEVKPEETKVETPVAEVAVEEVVEETEAPVEEVAVKEVVEETEAPVAEVAVEEVETKVEAPAPKQPYTGRKGKR